MKKLTLQEMKERISTGRYELEWDFDENKFYLVRYSSNFRTYEHLPMSEQRAREWYNAGIEVFSGVPKEWEKPTHKVEIKKVVTKEEQIITSLIDAKKK